MGRRALLYFLWEARPRGEAFPAPSRRRSPRGAPPTIGAACTALFFVGGPTSGRSFFRHRAGPFAAGRGSYNGRRAPLCFLWEARPRGEAFSDAEPAPFAADRGSYNSDGVHRFIFCGKPDLGAKLFRPRTGPFAAGRGSYNGRRALLYFCGRPDLGAKLFQTPSRRRSPRIAAPTIAAACTVFLWEVRLVGPQPMVIRLALPPAAAVLMLSARSISKRSSGISVSPGAMPCMPTIGPLRRASCWLTSRNWSELP